MLKWDVAGISGSKTITAKARNAQGRISRERPFHLHRWNAGRSQRDWAVGTIIRLQKMTPLIEPILELGGKLIDRLWANPEDKAKAQLELLKLQQNGDLKQRYGLQLALAQAQTNTTEAQTGLCLLLDGDRASAGLIQSGLNQMVLRPLIGLSGRDFPPLEMDTQ